MSRTALNVVLVLIVSIVPVCVDTCDVSPMPCPEAPFTLLNGPSGFGAMPGNADPSSGELSIQRKRGTGRAVVPLPGLPGMKKTGLSELRERYEIEISVMCKV